MFILFSIALESGYFLAHAIFLIRTRKLRARAKMEGVDFDDLPEARKYQWHTSKPYAELALTRTDDRGGVLYKGNGEID